MVCGPQTLCGLATTVFGWSISGASSANQSAPEPVNPSRGQGPAPGEGVGAQFVGFQGSVEQPPVVGGIEVVRRDEHAVSAIVCGGEQRDQMLDLVLGDAVAQHFLLLPVGLSTSFCGSITTTAVLSGG